MLHTNKQYDNWSVRYKIDQELYRNGDMYNNGYTLRYRYECMGATTLILKHAVKNKTLRILDAGCSSGKATMDCKSCLEENGYDVSMVAVDRDKKRIRTAMSRHSTIEFKCSEITDLQFENEFDIILCLNTIRFVSDKSKSLILRKFNSMLKSNGILITGISEMARTVTGMAGPEPPKCAKNHSDKYHVKRNCGVVFDSNDTRSFTISQILKYAELYDYRIFIHTNFGGTVLFPCDAYHGFYNTIYHLQWL